MFLSESFTHSASWCSTVCTVKRLRILWNCAYQSQVSHHGNICDLPPNSSWSYRATSSAPADGLSVWLVCQSGIPAAQLVESGYWREQFRTISEDVSVCNVLMHSAYYRGFTTMRYINGLFTCLLIVLLKLTINRHKASCGLSATAQLAISSESLVIRCSFLGTQRSETGTLDYSLELCKNFNNQWLN